MIGFCLHNWECVSKSCNNENVYRTFCSKCDKIMMCKKCGSNNIHTWWYEYRFSDCENCEKLRTEFLKQKTEELIKCENKSK